ncbi:glycosyl transferase group 1 [Paenibacillus curdlanolyticus YK9]|uniref:Glycosyl transferase group 1 n=1 Tax=Paenibacillus curdlanolyticus YK9 TaxID=717606 RepID=E0I751_9BACL|nr:glycosyltransferase [Paenibacillus curdlanolyticus]EFM11867.1 glycosyl transferase group 1 [Paenibacillus curdlanolyticus YK9]
MKFLLVQNTTFVPTLGGANKANRALMEQLAANGHSCMVIAPGVSKVQGIASRERFTEELDARGIQAISSAQADTFFSNQVEVHALVSNAFFRNVMKEKIQAFQPDLILVSSEDPAQVLLATALELSRKVIYICHTTLALPFGPDCAYESKAQKELLQKAAAVITVSEYLKDYLSRWGGISSEVISFPVYGNIKGSNVADFDKGYVTMINPSSIKGISIFTSLAERFPMHSFAAVPTWATTAQDLAVLRNVPNVTILEPRDNVSEIFERSKVLLVPSLWGEAFGQVAVEAMLHGIPVLSSDVGGLKEAKLGVSYSIPVVPIKEYTEQFDDRMIPIPVVPEQPLEQWEQSLQELLESRKHYQEVSVQSHAAAKKFVEQIHIGTFETVFMHLNERLSDTATEIEVDAEGSVNGSGSVSRLPSNLSADKKDLLMARLLEKMRSNKY